MVCAECKTEAIWVTWGDVALCHWGWGTQRGCHPSLQLKDVPCWQREPNMAFSEATEDQNHVTLKMVEEALKQ